MFGSVVFHMPGELQASPAIRGSWQKPILDLLLEAGVLGYANDVESAVAGFIGWCESQDPRPASLGVISLPGLAWRDDDWDPWIWYDGVIAEFEGWEPEPVLVDLENRLITHGGEVLWPKDGNLPAEQGVRLGDSPFLAGWIGQDLGEYRAGPDTYNCYRSDELPAISVPLDGSFGWLKSSHQHERSIAGNIDRTQDALGELMRSSIELPTDFVHFFRSHDLGKRIRSCTGCYLNLDSVAVAIPGELGWLVRFMSDSQGCRQWNLHISPTGRKHQVVATYFYTGSEDAQFGGHLPHARDTTICATSFEEFLYRLWIENEIWFALHDDGPMPERGSEYLAHYQPNP